MTPNAQGLTTRQRNRYTAANGYPATAITNIYDRPLLRKLEDFVIDIQNICVPGSYTLDLSKY